jgi:hypothetical protein
MSASVVMDERAQSGSLLLNSDKDGEAARAKELKQESLNSVLSNRDNINNLIDEIESLSKYKPFRK